MNHFISFITCIPFVGLSLAYLPSNKQEKLIYKITMGTILLHFVGLLILIGMFIASHFMPIYSPPIHLYISGTSDFSLDFFLDQYTAVYALTSSIITILVCIFSKYYIHREKGFRRFFNNMLFFYGGLQLLLMAGNFETMFVGWEILGITSFFLIGFYRDRYLPVKNAFKVISIYRIADIALLLGIWLSHHVHHRSIAFSEFVPLHGEQIHPIHAETLTGVLIPFIFLIAAMVKSAQFPFSHWLPRAMEGPTTSSAVFYGSLSVHIGIFLLIRIAPMWQDQLFFQLTVAVIGLLTAFIATTIARVQSTVKTQIAYASITQIGLIFVEVALGWYAIAMFHFVGNAFLRCYQLLVSPSVLSYKIHDQFFNFIQPQHHFPNNWIGKIRTTVFMLGIKEWNLDTSMYDYFWMPLKKLGLYTRLFITLRSVLLILIPLYGILLFLVYNKNLLPPGYTAILPEFLSFMALLLILRSFVERASVLFSWFLVLLNSLYMAMSIAFNETFDFNQVHLYLSGIFVCGVIGYWCFYKLRAKGENMDLDGYHGLSLLYPGTAFIFILACLGLAGFPNTPTFIGEDIMLGHIHENQLMLTILTALNLMLDGLVVFRIYSRIFLGPHIKGEMAFKSS